MGFLFSHFFAKRKPIFNLSQNRQVTVVDPLIMDM